MTTDTVTRHEQTEQTAEEHALLDRWRDRNTFVVYRCLTCGFRGVGASVTLHPYAHGPMQREERSK